MRNRSIRRPHLTFSTAGFYAQTVSEVAGAVEREHLTVERLSMMYMGITPWQDALDLLRDLP